MNLNAPARAEIDRLIERYPVLEPCRAAVEGATTRMAATLRSGGTVLTAGNGGSAADATHIVGELMKRFQIDRPLSPEIRSRIEGGAIPDDARDLLLRHLETPLRAATLVEDLSLATAFSNDAEPHLSMAQVLLGRGRAGDTLIAISTSGNSRNVLYAAYLARVMEINVVAMTGSGGGALRETADVTIAVPSERTADIQELHLPVYHTLCTAVEAHFFAGDVGDYF